MLQILKLDPSSFRQGGPIVDHVPEGDDINPSWIAEGGKDGWGFARRWAPMPTIALALLEEITHPVTRFGFALVMLSSAAAALVASLKPTKSERWRGVVGILQFVASLSLIAVAALACLLAYSIFGASIALIVVSLLFGGMLAAAALWISSRLPSHKAIRPSAA
jgi:hypothetical protein